MTAFLRRHLRTIVVSLALVAALTTLHAGGIASVDYSVLLAFHPQMARFDFTVQRFFQPDLNLSDSRQMESVRQKMAEKAAQAHTERQNLERERNRIQREIARIEETSNQTISAMLRDNKDVTSFQNTYRTKLQALNAQLSELDRKFLAIQEAGLDVIYQSREKSQALFLQVQNEIDQHLAAVATERGGVSIIDRSFLAPPASTFAPPVPVSNIDPVTADLYSQLLNFDFTVPAVEGHGPEGHLDRVKEGVESRFRDQLQRYVSQTPALRPVIANVRGRLLVAGGEDLTALVLGRILDAHRTRPEVKNRLLQLLSSLP
ncbi:MAG TPA: hypothetical protein PKO06_20785 [Candidatus Ozemobacteraceae bacterium]|nr:hypothetical protein [Candidatus Ozemobacteraceae bacterium]